MAINIGGVDFTKIPGRLKHLEGKVKSLENSLIKQEFNIVMLELAYSWLNEHNPSLRRLTEAEFKALRKKAILKVQSRYPHTFIHGD